MEITDKEVFEIAINAKIRPRKPTRSSLLSPPAT